MRSSIAFISTAKLVSPAPTVPGVIVKPQFATNPLEHGIVASQADGHAIAQGIAEAAGSFTAGVAPR